MYTIIYNDIDLTDIVKVRSVEIPSLPSIDHSSYDVFERHGNVFNGASYNNREIKLTFIIQPDRVMEPLDPEDPESPLFYNEDKTIKLYDEYVNDVKRAFYTQEECKLFCGNEELYMWCVPIDDVIVTELGGTCAEVEVNLVAYDPYWYSIYPNIVNNDDQRRFEVVNDSDVAVYPVLQVGFTKDTTFVQIENQTNGERLLIGQIPTVEAAVVKKNPSALVDEMESTSGWMQYSGAIDGDRSAGGTLSVTSNGCGLMAGNFGSSSSGATWHGACYRKNLDDNRTIKNFKCRFRFTHNSTGTNGDPTHPYQNDSSSGSSTTTTVTSGKKTTYYIVSPSIGLNVRSGPGTSYSKICAMPQNTKVYPSEIKNGWAKVSYNGKTGWCDMNYLTPRVGDSSVITDPATGTVKECNYVTMKSTAIRNTPYKTAKNNKSIPAGTCIRVITSEKYPATHENKDLAKIFYKLAKPYEGASGYVLKDNLAQASDFEVDYNYEINTADDKTGIVEIYGCASDGTQLFRLGMYDDNEYYEFTYPVIRKNNADFLVDKTVAPNAKTITKYENDTKKVERILSGRYGDWNEFYGELYIERINNKWYAYVTKITDGQVVKEIKSKSVTDTKNGDKNLAYLILYIGTTGDADKASGMSVSYINIKSEDIDKTVKQNLQEFEVGDILTIDHSIPNVRLNDKECNELIDIGSAFFKLEPGENTIKVASDDTPNVDVIWNDKRL